MFIFCFPFTRIACKSSSWALPTRWWTSRTRACRPWAPSSSWTCSTAERQPATLRRLRPKRRPASRRPWHRVARRRRQQATISACSRTLANCGTRANMRASTTWKVSSNRSRESTPFSLFLSSSLAQKLNAFHLYIVFFRCFLGSSSLCIFFIDVVVVCWSVGIFSSDYKYISIFDYGQNSEISQYRSINNNAILF